MEQLNKGDARTDLATVLLAKYLTTDTPLTADEVSRLLSRYTGYVRVNLAYYLGEILLSRKEPKRAAELFQEAAKANSLPGAISSILAGQMLNEMKGR